MSELIHRSEQHLNLESASVSVYFHDIIDTGLHFFFLSVFFSLLLQSNGDNFIAKIFIETSLHSNNVIIGENEEDYEILHGTETVVTRTAFKNNSSRLIKIKTLFFFCHFDFLKYQRIENDINHKYFYCFIIIIDIP